MGAWGPLAFDNDQSCDWASDFNEVDDLSLVEEAFDIVDASDDSLYTSDAEIGLAACEVLARLRGNYGYRNPYTETIDAWVQMHRIIPPPELLTRAESIIDRILGSTSALRELWEDADATEWLAAVADLRRRLRE